MRRRLCETFPPLCEFLMPKRKATAAKKAAAKSSNKKAKRPAAGKAKTAKAAGGPGVVVEACKS